MPGAWRMLLLPETLCSPSGHQHFETIAQLYLIISSRETNVFKIGVCASHGPGDTPTDLTIACSITSFFKKKLFVF